VSHDPIFNWLGDDASKLNGSSSYSTPETARLREPGDGIVGVVVSVEDSTRGDKVTTLRIEKGRCAGEDVESGSWLRLWWSNAELRRAWEQVGGVEVGARLTLGYRGKERWNAAGMIRNAYAVHVERAAVHKEGEKW
jgi:hypothetical protein